MADCKQVSPKFRQNGANEQQITTIFGFLANNLFAKENNISFS